MRNSVQGVAFLLRKTHLSLSELRHSLDIGQFRELYEEVLYQEQEAEYQKALYVAHIRATIANTVPRKGGGTIKATDLMAVESPRRKGAGAPPDEKEALETLAAKFGIKLPGKEIREL